MKKLISLVIVCYNEEENIIPCQRALTEITRSQKNYTFEFVYTDNGSSDDTRKMIKKIAEKDARVTGVFLSRNFGPESSIQAGLDHAKGDAVIIYEGDMQDPPEVIADFIRQWEAGYDVVVGVRTKIEDKPMMTFIRSVYYKVFHHVANIYIPVNAGLYSLLSRKIVDAIHSLPEKYRFFRGLRSWVGFKTTYVSYQRRKRERGKSSYSLWGYLSHAERSFFGFSYLQLTVIVYAGLALVALSFLALLITLTLFLIYRVPPSGISLVLIAIIFFGGIELMAISIIGKYIQVIVEETKARPVYIVEEVFKKVKARSQ